MLNTFRLGAAMEHRAEEGALGQDSCISANMRVISLLTHVYSMFLQKYRYRTQIKIHLGRHKNIFKLIISFNGNKQVFENFLG